MTVCPPESTYLRLSPVALSLKDAAAFLGTSERALQRLEAAGTIKRLPSIKSFAVADLCRLVDDLRSGAISDAKETHDEQISTEESPLGGRRPI